VNIAGDVLSVGDHPGLCFVDSNDPDEPVVDIPILVTITAEVLPPEVVITAPASNAIIDTSTVVVEYTVNNFNVAPPNSGDGYVRFNLDQRPGGIRYGVGPLTFANLFDGEHVARVWLVDNAGNELDPAAIDSVTFTVDWEQPMLTLSPEAYSLNLRQGSIYTDTVTITNTGNVGLDFDIQNGAMVTSTLSHDSLAVNESLALPFQIDLTEIATGQYDDTLKMITPHPELPEIQLPFQIEVVTPAVAISYPADEAVIDTTLIEVRYSVHNFIVASPGNGDGYLKFDLDRQSATDQYTTDPLTFSNLADGEHLVRIWLVDNDGIELKPRAMDSVIFTIDWEQPMLTLSPDFYSLTLMQGQQYLDTLLVTNTGNVDLTFQIHAGTMVSSSVSHDSLAVDAVMSLPFQIDLTEIATGQYDDTLKIFSDHPKLPEVGVLFNIEVIPSVGIDPEDFKPDHYFLSQNYPNPFNPTTRIVYYLPHDSRVKLTIFDFLGNEIRTLVNSNQTANCYQISWDAKDKNGEQLPSGMYFYRLSARSARKQFMKTRKMILLH